MAPMSSAAGPYSSPGHGAQPRPARREDNALLRGRGRFVGDIALQGMLQAAFVRSPYPHALVRQVDTAAATASPGVAAVLTAADFAGLSAPQVNELLPGMVLAAGELLSLTHVRAVGEPVALVLADSLAQAEAGAALVQVDYEELAPRLPFSEADGPADAAVAQTVFSSGPLPAGVATATAQVQMPRVSPAPLEPRACLASWDEGASTLAAWLSTQTPSRARADLARCLGLPLESVRVIAPDVGGAFGGKASVFPEDLLVAHAARRLRRAVRWQSTRAEDLQYATHGRGSRSRGAIWLDDARKIAAVDASFEFSLGHWLPYSAVAPMRNAQRIVPGPYRVAVQQSRATAARSNTAAVNIYRGAGRPEAAVLMERLVDAAAVAAGLDPLQLRLDSVWPRESLPATLPNGETLDRCDLQGLLLQAADAFGYQARRAAQAQRRAAGEFVGLGIGLYVEPCGQGWESARLTCSAPGCYTLATGASAQGQGRETAFAAIAAEALACDPAQVTVLHGDTGTCPVGIGALASRSTAIGGSAVLEAARRLRAELAAGSPLPHTVEVVYHAQHEAWASGCVMCQVTVDPDTGVLAIEHLEWVDDAGRVIDPVLVHGQMMGGMAQGLGQALMERIVYDEQGQLLTGSFMDYAMPRADDMPRSVRLRSRPTPSAANPLGAKGVGEAGCIGVPAALLNSAYDALGHPPGLQLDFPLTPDQLWRALRDTARNQDRSTR
jgi:carbon-monoxide dehydrogenase large subunit